MRRPGLVAVRVQRPKCPKCRGYKLAKRSSREFPDLKELHVYADCKGCGFRFRLIYDGDL